MQDRLATADLGRAYPFCLRRWNGTRYFGFVGRPVWVEVRLRGTVPVVVRFQAEECLAKLFDAGEHHLHISDMQWKPENISLAEYSDAEATFRIDWERAVPERMAAEILGDSELLRRWQALGYEAACDLIAPVRRARSPKSIAVRETEALAHLKAGSPRP